MTTLIKMTIWLTPSPLLSLWASFCGTSDLNLCSVCGGGGEGHTVFTQSTNCGVLPLTPITKYTTGCLAKEKRDTCTCIRYDTGMTDLYLGLHMLAKEKRDTCTCIRYDTGMTDLYLGLHMHVQCMGKFNSLIWRMLRPFWINLIWILRRDIGLLTKWTLSFLYQNASLHVHSLTMSLW